MDTARRSCGWSQRHCPRGARAAPTRDASTSRPPEPPNNPLLARPGTRKAAPASRGAQPRPRLRWGPRKGRLTGLAGRKRLTQGSDSDFRHRQGGALCSLVRRAPPAGKPGDTSPRPEPVTTSNHPTQIQRAPAHCVCTAAAAPPSGPLAGNAGRLVGSGLGSPQPITVGGSAGGEWPEPEAPGH